MSKLNILISIYDIINSDAALTPSKGDIVFLKIENAIESNDIAIIDFNNINYLTTAFLNAAIGQLYSKYSSTDLNSKIKIINLSSIDAVMLNKVIKRAKEYFANKDSSNNPQNETLLDE